MSEIKRYAIICAYNEDGEPEALKMPDNTGEWVRWEDVQELLKKQEDDYAQETQLLIERINRLVKLGALG